MCLGFSRITFFRIENAKHWDFTFVSFFRNKYFLSYCANCIQFHSFITREKPDDWCLLRAARALWLLAFQLTRSRNKFINSWRILKCWTVIISRNKHFRKKYSPITVNTVFIRRSLLVILIHRVRRIFNLQHFAKYLDKVHWICASCIYRVLRNQ